MTEKKQKSEDAVVESASAAKRKSLKWDDSSMSTSYANVTNVSITREECGLFFGTNLTTGMGVED
jgi:hypothetical protein